MTPPLFEAEPLLHQHQQHQQQHLHHHQSILQQQRPFATIPTPESSPSSSCTSSEAFHPSGGLQLSASTASSLGLVLEGGGGGGGLRYALPTPDVSPLDGAGGGPGRSLDYLGHHYSSLAQERFAFESGPLPGERRRH
jgi:hypothetical protein